MQNIRDCCEQENDRATRRRSPNQSFIIQILTNLVSEIHIFILLYNNPKEQAEYSNPIFRDIQTKRLKFPFTVLPLVLFLRASPPPA